MKVQGEKTFAAPRATVWRVLNDPASMAKTMPGVESFDIQDDRHWRANVKIPLGLGGLRMSVDFEKTDERAPEYSSLHAKGNGVGAIMNMQTQFHLDESGDATAMRWEAEVSIAGPVGSMGQRVLQPIVNQQVAQVLASLEKQVEEAHAGGGETFSGPEPGGAPEEGAAHAGAGDTGDSAGPSSGSAGAPTPTTDVETHTDPEPKDYGPPADSSPEPDPPAGTSGADEGVSPWSPESYTPDPEGPTQSTED